MAEIIVTSTADSGAGSLRAAIAAAQNGDVILFDPVVFPTNTTTTIYLSSYITIDKSISIYGGESDGEGGYTSGATKEYYVYRDVEDVRTKVVIASPDDAQEGEIVLCENICRVALDGQNTARCVWLNSTTDANCVFSGVCFKNGSTTSAGGVYISNTNRNTFIDCAFESCVATSYGGGLFTTNEGQNTLNGCVISNCSASNGGGVYTASTTQNTLNGCVIDGCSATTNGAAIYSTGTSQNTLNGCTFASCGAKAGGALLGAGTSKNTLNDCVFDACTETANGGSAIYITSANQNAATGCRFMNCVATNKGTVAVATSGQITLDSCLFTSCSANIGAGCWFGDTSVNTLVGCIFDSCAATNGGGVYSTSTSQNTLTDCAITNCSATTNGGGVYSGSTAKVWLNNCSIDSCAASNGGGVSAYDTSEMFVNDCAILGNETTSSEPSKRDASIISNSTGCINNSRIGSLRVNSSATLTIKGIVIADLVELLDSSHQSINIDDGAALTVTQAMPNNAATFTSEGRGYLAVAAGINTSAATLNGVVLCSYGADVSSFAEVDGVLEWEADDPSVSVLIEREDNDAWTTLAQTTGESLDYYLPPKVNLRLFDGERFLTTATPDSRTYFYIGGAEGSFADAEDWSLTKDGTAIPQSPTIADCAFVIQGAEGNVAISKGSANVTNATIIPAGTNDIAVTVDEATVLAGTERFTGTLTTTGDVAITGDASKLAIVIDGTLEVAGSLKLATLTLASGSSVVFASADDVLVVTGSATVNDATFSCEEPTAYFTAPVGTNLTQATFTNVYVATKGAEVVSVTGSRFGKNYSINIISEDNTLPVTVEYRLEGTTEWIVADPAFVGTTFQIRLDDDATFRVYNGETFTEATMKVYGLYNEMAAIVEIGYLI